MLSERPVIGECYGAGSTRVEVRATCQFYVICDRERIFPMQDFNQKFHRIKKYKTRAR